MWRHQRCKNVWKTRMCSDELCDMGSEGEGASAAHFQPATCKYCCHGKPDLSKKKRPFALSPPRLSPAWRVRCHLCKETTLAAPTAQRKRELPGRPASCLLLSPVLLSSQDQLPAGCAAVSGDGSQPSLIRVCQVVRTTANGTVSSLFPTCRLLNI